ncbi:MAG: ribosome biogenesis GTPase YqeH [Erysipelotrichaceae bacterium]|nr:ribosome biogenesis GTPase YqeH [Erysipelotrichaceae bacterium]
MTKELRCYGCGAIIQSENEKHVGYVPKNALNNDVVLCKRCFRMKNYHELQFTLLTNDDFLKILQKIGEQDCLVVYIIDLFDFNGSMINGFIRHINYNDVLVVGNKRDILPKSVKDTKIKHWVQRQLKEYNIKPKDVILTSATKNYQLDEVLEAINLYRQNRDVYVVGVTNVGKSSFINALLKHYTSQHELLITTSEFPGTTLDLIEIPFDEHTSLYDSPGIINPHQMAHLIETKDLKTILPNSELRPSTYQLNAKQTLYFGALARLDYVNGQNASFVCFMPKTIKVHRTKLEKADDLYNRHLTLTPEIKSIQNIKEMTTYQFTSTHKKSDIVISGLGWVRIDENTKVTVHVPKGVGVFIREALI